MELPAGFRYAALALVFLSLVLPAAAGTSTTTAQGGTSSSFSSTCILSPSAGNITPDSCIASAIPFMAVGILISFLVIAVIFLAGNVMNFKPLKDWYRAELWEVIKTLIVIGVVISSLVIMSGIAYVLAGGTYAQQAQAGTPGALSTNLANLYNADNVYINQQLDTADQAYAAMLGLSTGIGILRSFNLYLWIPIPLIPPDIFGSVQFGSIEPLFVSNFITSTPAESSYSLTGTLTSVVIIPMLILFQFQSTFFYDVVTLGLGVLIPLGLIFRAFPLIRSIGGTLIATGIGLAIIYPSLILVLNMPISNYIYTFTYSQTLSSSCPFAAVFLCKYGWSPAMAAIAGSNPLSSVSGLSPALTVPVAAAAIGTGSMIKFPLVVALGSGAASDANIIGAMNEGVAVGLATPLTSGIFPTLNFILAQSLGMIMQFILVAIDLLVGIVIVGAVTSTLGGKVRLGLGSKLGIKTGG